MAAASSATITDDDLAALLDTVRKAGTATGFRNVKRTRTGKFQAIVYNKRLSGQQSLGSFDNVQPKGRLFSWPRTSGTPRS